jgi:hypothetical protein
VSEPIYREIVEHEWRGIHKSDYHRIFVKVKETQAPAWVHAPGWRGPEAATSAAAPEPGEDRVGPVTNVVHHAGTVITGDLEVGRDLRIGGRNADDPS